MQVERYVLLALAPGLFWLWWLRRRDDLDPEPLRLVLLDFALGIGLALGVLALRPSLDAWVLSLPEASRRFADAFLATAPVEEVAKMLPLFLAWRRRAFDEPLDGVIYGTAVALGFASLENFLYLRMSGDPVLILMRGFTAVPIHVACSGATGLLFGIAKFRRGPERPLLILCGLIFAIALHGLYDWLLAAPDLWQQRLALTAVVPAAFVLLALKIRWARGNSPHVR
ncbi:MAG: PrsW family intramembrane metalloprotease [Planctomycetota bacterium]